MDQVDVYQLQEMFIAASDRLVESEPLLTQLDRMTGDGDHGIAMMTGFSAVKDTLENMPEFNGIVPLLTQIGTTLIDTIGGASGVLFGTLFISGARQLGHKHAMTATDFAQLFNTGTEAIRQRGQAKLGDKTMLDALIPASIALQTAANAGDSVESALRCAATAAAKGVDATKTMLASAGRAKAYADKSIGHSDAGATSSSILINALADYAENLANAQARTHECQ